MEYTITIMRWNDNDEREELVDQYITADQAIDAMLFVQGFAPIEEEEEIAEEEDTTVTVTASNVTEVLGKAKAAVSTPKSSAKSKGARTCSHCGKQGHNRKTCPGDADETPVPSTGQPATAYMAKRAEKEAEPSPEVNVEAEIKLAFVQGFTLAEVAPMFPTVEMARLVELKAEATR